MRFEKQTFENQDVPLDGNEFIECTFRNCVMQFGAAAPVKMNTPQLYQCKWELIGAANLTVNFLTGLYHGGAKELIEQTFENIRKGISPQLEQSGGVPPGDTIHFEKCVLDSQEYGSDEEHMISRVFFDLVVGGKMYQGLTADIKQTVGSDYAAEPIIEVSPPAGYSGPLNYHKYRAVIEEYYLSLVSSQGSGFRLGTAAHHIRMQQIVLKFPRSIQIDVKP